MQDKVAVLYWREVGAEKNPATSAFDVSGIAESECALLHECLFKRSCPEEITRRYAGIYRLYFDDPASRALSSLLIEKRIDVEAVEFVCRLRNGKNPVTRRVASLTHLCEAHRDYFSTYVNERSNFLGGIFSLATGGLAAVYKAAKGFYLIKRYGIRC